MEPVQDTETNFDAEMHLSDAEATENASELEGSENASELEGSGEDGEVSNDNAMPRLRLDGNEWLEAAMRHRPRATVNDLKVALSEPSLSRVLEFFTEELASGDGLCGGGLCHIVARAFQQKNNNRLDRKRTPSFGEAKWHLDNLAQHLSMNEKQRKRQSDLNQKLYAGLKANSSLLKETFVPQPSQIGRHYGGSGQRHSMHELLPVPKATDIDGVAYVGPTTALKFAFANGIPMDNIVIAKPTTTVEATPNAPVLHVEQSRKAQEWLNRVKKRHFGEGKTENETVMGVIVMDWKDGFAYSGVKSNRGSVDVKTFNISPPKKLTNE